MITLRKADERGHTDLGWLNSWHTFSFADYYDTAHMGFRTLRVINDDRVASGKGFGTHPHRDMEIFSYVLEGALEHKDSLGNGRVLRPGQIQLMSAGKGVTHSEFNPSRTEGTHFLQIWIMPEERGLHPRYTEWKPDPAREGEIKVLVISKDGRDGSALIHQDVDVYRVRLESGQNSVHELRSGRGVWLHVARGTVTVNGLQLGEGDGAAIEGESQVTVEGRSSSEALLFDLA